MQFVSYNQSSVKQVLIESTVENVISLRLAMASVRPPINIKPFCFYSNIVEVLTLKLAFFYTLGTTGDTHTEPRRHKIITRMKKKKKRRFYSSLIWFAKISWDR